MHSSFKQSAVNKYLFAKSKDELEYNTSLE